MHRPLRAAITRDRARSLSNLATTTLTTTFVLSCASVPPAELSFDSTIASMERRADASHLDDVLEGMEFERSSIRVPSEDERRDPQGPGYWTTRALAWSPGVRAARRDWRAARALAESAGAPAPIWLQAVDHDFGSDDELLEAAGVVDVLGLLGIGPSNTDRKVASANEALALGRLELAAWRAELAVERARIGCVAASARAANLSALAADAQLDLERVTILERHGRVARTHADAARALVLGFERNASIARDALTRRRAELVRASGVPVDDPAVTALTRSTTDAPARLRAEASRLTRAPMPSMREHAATHPVAREARLVFATREAEARDVAAAAWPTLSLGPHIGIVGNDGIGGILRLTLPFPSSWRGRLEAAIERRDAAIEAYEDTVHHLHVALGEQATLLEASRARLASTTRDIDGSTERHWRAVRAAFRTNRADVEEWMQVLMARANAINLEIDDAERAAIAALDLYAARGPSSDEEADS